MASTYHAQIQELYVAYFNRPADYLGLDYWEKAIENAVAAAGSNTAAQEAAIQATLGQISAGFAASDEYNAVYGGKATEQVIGAVYQNLFGHAPDLPGLIFWVEAVRGGHMTVADAVTTIAAGAQGSDLVTFNNKVEAATAFTNQLDTGDEVLGYNGEKALAAAKSFIGGITTDASLEAALDPVALAASVKAVVDAGLPPVTAVNAQLTKAIDTLAGGAGNDTFTAIDLEWTSLDSVDGGTGNDTFTVAQTAAITGAPAGVVVKNMETVNLISGGAITVDASSFDTDVLNITAGGASDVTASSTTDVNELGSTAASEIYGGKDVTVVSSGASVYVEGAAGTVDVTATKAGATVDVVDAEGAVIVAANGNITADGVTLDASIIDAVSRATEMANVVAAATAASNKSNADYYAGVAADQVTALNDLQASLEDVTVDSYAEVAALTFDAYASFVISREDKLAIDAAFAAGSATDLATAKAAVLAALVPLQTAATADATSTAQAALVAAAALTSANNKVAGNLADAGQTVAAIGSTTLTEATVTGNFAGATNLSDGSTLKNVLTSVTLDHAGTANLTGDAITHVTMANMNKAVTVTNTTTGHAANLTLNNVGSASSAQATAAAFSDAMAAKVTITSEGTATNRLASLTANLAKDVVITGAAGVSITTLTAAADAAINASTSTGAITLKVGANQSYAGGSGADSITATGTTAQLKVIDGGAGTADKLTVEASGVLTVNDAETQGAVNFKNFEILQVNGGVTADVSEFTNSAFTSIVKGGTGAAVINGLNATQAAAVTVTSTGGLTIGVDGATTIGQLDTVHLTTSSTGAIDFGTALVVDGVETLHVTGNAKGAGTTIGSLTGLPDLTSLIIDGSRAVTVTTGAFDVAVNTVINASANTWAVTIDSSASTTNGLKIIGAINGENYITTNDLANVVQVGDIYNEVTTGLGNDVITAGNGDSIIHAGAGNNKVTVGNGFNSIVTGAGADTISVGTGINWIESGTGADKISLAADSTAGVINYVYVADAAAAGANMDTITGLTGADKLMIDTVGGLDLTVGTGKAMLGVLTHTTTVADMTAVYAALVNQLDNSTGHEFAGSTDAVNGVIGRMVTFTTGAAAGTYLVINDETAGFDGTQDIVIKLVGSTGITGDVIAGFEPMP